MKDGFWTSLLTPYSLLLTAPDPSIPEALNSSIRPSIIPGHGIPRRQGYGGQAPCPYTLLLTLSPGRPLGWVAERRGSVKV